VHKRLLLNAVHPGSFSWKTDFLPRLREMGFMFQVLDFSEWLEKLRNSETDLDINPSRKLLGFWEGLDRQHGNRGEIKFDTTPAEEISATLKKAQRVVDEDLVKELLEAWKRTW